MNVKLLLFAAAKEIIGENQLTLQLPPSADVGTLKRTLVTEHPSLSDLVLRSAFSVDQKYANNDTVINPQSEVAMIPPVSGG